ncbi:MAG: High-affinity zinc uptake system ATP-binding protein ZnuC [Actinomycetota bacterium]|jgi:zinc transport system ATP-binding protein
MSAALVCRDVCIDIESACILSNVNLAVEPGEFVAVLGANGSGKTTLMRAMLGLIPITSGGIDIFGTPIGHFREWQRLAYVPQRLHSAGAVPVSVHEVVGAGLISPHQRLPRRGDRQRVAEALAQVGLADRRRDRFDALSGGQQRRVMIAAALAKDADLYVLDEPTAGVDAESQERISETFGSLHAAGRTVVLVTHELGPFSTLASRIVVLGSPRGETSTVLYDGPPPVPDHLLDRVWHHSEDVVMRAPEPGVLEPGAG